MIVYEVDWHRWLREHRNILRVQLNLLDGEGANLGSRYTDPLFRVSAREIVAEWIDELDDLIGSDDARKASDAAPTKSATPPARNEGGQRQLPRARPGARHSRSKPRLKLTEPSSNVDPIASKAAQVMQMRIVAEIGPS
jgi:hypothetical protein